MWRKKRMKKIHSMANDEKKWWSKVACTIHIYGVIMILFFKLEMQTKYKDISVLSQLLIDEEMT